MLSVTNMPFTLSVVMLNVVMLNVMAPRLQLILLIIGEKKVFMNFEPEDESEDQFAEEALKAHNMYRARHNVGPLKLDKKVSEGKNGSNLT